MDKDLNKKIHDIRQVLGGHLQIINGLVEPFYDRKTWTARMAEDALQAVYVAFRSAETMIAYIRDLQKEKGIKEDNILLERVIRMKGVVGKSYSISKNLINLSNLKPRKEEDLKNGASWAAFPNKYGIEFFKDNFGRFSWGGLRATWSVLFFLPIAIEIIQIQLSGIETRNYYEDEKERAIIIKRTKEIAEEKIAIVELYDNDDPPNMIDAWGPEEVRTVLSHAAGEMYKGQAPDPKKTGHLSRPLTKSEMKRYSELTAEIIYGELVKRYSGKIPEEVWDRAISDAEKRPWVYLPYMLGEIKDPGGEELKWVEGITARSMPLKSTFETYITKDKYFVSKGKRISRKLSRDELMFVRDMMKHKPESTIEEIAKGLELYVVPLPAEYEFKDIEYAFHAEKPEARKALQAATPNMAYVSQQDAKVSRLIWRSGLNG